MAFRIRLLNSCRRLLSREACRRFRTTQEAPPTATPLEVSVEDSRVQDLLTRLTGMDFDRVFAARQEPLTVPEYKLMTEEQLKQAHVDAQRKAREVLRMPPILPDRPPRGAVLQKDAQLEGYLDSKMIFTDISMNKDNNDRTIVVREPSGDLREATWEERDRMCQVYMPVLGRKLWLPTMLTASHLPSALEKDLHQQVLDLVCVQCEPGSEDYIRVHHIVYEDLDRRNLYDLLRSTRHFGGIVWYLVEMDRIQGLMEDTLRRELFSNAEDLVRLHLLCHVTSDLSERAREGDSGMELVKLFLDRHGLRELINLIPVDSGSTEQLHNNSTAV